MKRPGTFSNGSDGRPLVRRVSTSLCSTFFFLLSFFLNIGLLNYFLSSSKNTKKNRPLTFQLKSGWDDMLDERVPKTKAKPSITISSTCSSPVSDDDDFKNSTLSYLGSPTAKTLGLSGAPVPQKAVEMPKSSTSSPVSPTIHKAADNLACSPPNSALPSLPESSHRSRSRSPSNLPPDERISTLTPIISLFPSI